MRGSDGRTDELFSSASCEARVPADRPLRAIRQIVDAALEAPSPAFELLYARSGRSSVSPETLFRWFVGLPMDAAAWDVTVFTKNRERLIEGRPGNHRITLRADKAYDAATFVADLRARRPKNRRLEGLNTAAPSG